MPRTLVLAVLTACASSASDQAYRVKKGLLDQLAGQRDWEAVQRVAPELLSEHPRDAEVWMLRGVALREQGEFGAAEEALREALAIDDSLAYVHSALGVLYDLTHRWPDAEKSHQRALSLAPNEPEFLNNLGFSHLVHGKFRDAAIVLHRALQVDPANERMRNNLGFVFASMGQMREAADQFERGGPPAQARSNLALAYERRGDRTRAKELYGEALALDASLVVARNNLDRLVSLEPAPEGGTP